MGMDRYKMDMSKDPLFRGEFEVIKELIAELADGEASKRECDKVIDKNGPTKTGGTGIKQLRENIAESKLSSRSWMTPPRCSSSPRSWTTSTSIFTSLCL